ncbi:MAG TPA: S8 family serine peptidase [Steroidobacteraceae bacterium]|nr:S8 family serine peptidase [Steroidobacteraceae bacterium]
MAPVIALAALAGCGGGSGGSSSSSSSSGSSSSGGVVPTVTLTASATSIVPGGEVTLTWSSRNATTCVASGGWTGSRGISGSERVTPTTASTSYALECGTSGTMASTNVTIAVAPPATVAVAGQIIVPDLTRVDTDTNDILLTPVANNTFQTAQALPNPAIVGGYVNMAGAGEDGPLKTSGDAGDFFRVDLLRGQVIELTVANPAPATNDVDLQLYASNQTLVDAAIGIDTTERLVVPANGTYYVRAVAYAGASNYVLTIGQTGTTAVASDLVLSRAFVPGELLVKPKGIAAAGAASAETKANGIAGKFGLHPRPSAPQMHVLMKIDGSTLQAMDVQRKQTTGDGAAIRFESEEARLKYTTLQTIKSLATAGDVEWAEPNWVLTASAVPNDPGYPRQRWHYEMIHLPAAWDTTTGSANVVAAVVDSGVRRHADLVDHMDPGYDFVSGAGAGDGNGDDNDPSDPGSPSQGTLVFHGTHVAGTIGATSNNGQGVAGVAWNVRLLPVRVLGIEGGSGEDIAQGILFAAGLPNRAGVLPVRKADVINLSLGGPGGCSQAFRDVFARVRAAGVIVIAAAGNENAAAASFPASCPGVVAVSSVGVHRSKAPYSNYGTDVDVAAPGGDRSRDLNGDGFADGVYSTYSSFNGTNYLSTFTDLQGTSMAAPHVAGVVALMKSVNSALTPAQFDSLLASGALTDDIGPPGADVLGIGLINAAKAVQAASGTPPTAPARLTATPASLNFGNAVTSSDVVVASAGNGTVSVTSTAVSAPWISVVGPAGAGALGSYRIQINRTGLAAGTYNGWVEFRGSVGAAVRVTLIMQVTTVASVADAGQHYVLLIDPATGDTKYQQNVNARGSPTAFRFTGVAPGTYLLSAGTDLNDDTYICDDGEACAEYPEFGEAQPLVIDRERSGLTLTTGFRVYSNTTTTAAGAPRAEPVRAFRRLR